MIEVSRNMTPKERCEQCAKINEHFLRLNTALSDELNGLRKEIKLKLDNTAPGSEVWTVLKGLLSDD